MRTFIVLSALLILLIACAQQAPPPAPVPPPQQTQEPEPIVAQQGNTVRILGLGASEPAELTISSGEEVTFVSEFDRKDTLVFKMQGKVTMETSPAIEAGTSYSKTFTEKGVYEYWTVGFGPKGAKIIVE